MSAPRMTAVFECDIQKIEGNPFHIETPFGKAISVGIGDAFSEIEELEARADPCDPTQDERVKALEAENARLRDALKASREVHCGISEHILACGKYAAGGPVDTKGIFADSQRARLGVDAALRDMGVV